MDKQTTKTQPTYVDLADRAGFRMLVGTFLGRVAFDHHLDRGLVHEVALGDHSLDPAHVCVGHIDLVAQVQQMIRHQFQTSHKGGKHEKSSSAIAKPIETAREREREKEREIDRNRQRGERERERETEAVSTFVCWSSIVADSTRQSRRDKELRPKRRSVRSRWEKVYCD